MTGSDLAGIRCASGRPCNGHQTGTGRRGAPFLPAVPGDQASEASTELNVALGRMTLSSLATSGRK